MNIADLTTEQKKEFDELKTMFNSFADQSAKMSSTLYPDKLITFTINACKAESVLKSIIQKMTSSEVLNGIITQRQGE